MIIAMMALLFLRRRRRVGPSSTVTVTLRLIGSGNVLHASVTVKKFASGVAENTRPTFSA
jgi:hypothetical protein